MMQFLSAGLSAGAIAGIVIGAIVVLVLFWFVIVRNALIALRNDTEEAFSAMDVHMKKRYDLIPNLVSTCKGYAKHESETFTRVTEARNAAMAAARAAQSGQGGDEARISAERELGSSLRTLLTFVQEQYPQLKADSQFNNLSQQLGEIEEEIARSRKYYNAQIKKFNNKIEQFPSNIVANSMKLARKAFFELEDTSERVAPKVSFDN